MPDHRNTGHLGRDSELPRGHRLLGGWRPLGVSKKETEVALVLTKLGSYMHRNQTFRAPLASTLATLLRQPTAEGQPSPEDFSPSIEVSAELSALNR
jgi:hypothetical protein